MAHLPDDLVSIARLGRCNRITGGAVAWSLTATAAITLACAPLTLHLYNKQG